MPRKAKVAPTSTYRKRKDGQPIGAASFVINDTGHLSILDGQQVINLEKDDVTRLAAFLERTESIRK